MGLQAGAPNLKGPKATWKCKSAGFDKVVALLRLFLAHSTHAKVTAGHALVVHSTSFRHFLMTNIAVVPGKEAQLLSFGSCGMASWTEHGLWTACEV